MKSKGLLKVIGNGIVKNSPAILTGAGVAGVVTTTIMAVKATPEVVRKLQDEGIIDERLYLFEDKTPKDVIKSAWKAYIPSFLMGGVTIVCIIGANSVNYRRNAALVSAYSLTEATLKEYQTKVVEKLGEKKAQEIKDEIAQEMIVKNPLKDSKQIIFAGGDTLCYDSYSGRYFKSEIEKLRKIENEFNKSLLNYDFLTINDLYSRIGLPEIPAGEDLGWRSDKLLNLDFTSKLTEGGQPCLVIGYLTGPHPRFR